MSGSLSRRIGLVWRMRLTRIVAVVCAVLLAAGGGWLLYDRAGDTSCGDGVEERGPDGECTGVTDGGTAFSPSLAKVSARIAKENRRVAEDVHATVAFMIPMTSQNDAEQRQILEEVQGAYLAQFRANHLSNSRAPAIRLVLANPGRGYGQWRPVADQLAAMAASGTDNLRAVTGFNVSVRDSKEAIAYLTNEKGIPVVGGPITADDIANTPERPRRFDGLARVAPTNSDQAAALGSFYASETSSDTMVVADIREDDNYISTLRETFEKLAADAPLAPEVYESPPNVNDEGNTSNDFRQMVGSICGSKVAKIYFAGRPVQLRQFVNELGDRPCTARRFTVVSGSHASTLAVDRKFAWEALSRGEGITMRYASLAHPDAWTGGRAPGTGGSAEAFGKLGDLVDTFSASGRIGRLSLRDSRTIIAHDSVHTAVTGIRNSTVGDVEVPQLSQVGRAWLRLHGQNRVDGASGWICLDRYGRTYDKAVHVVHLDPESRAAVFDGIAWPEGSPPGADCSVPNRR